jgi:hypothetical protein
MHMTTRPILLCVGLSWFAITGCADPKSIQVTTVVRGDGSCERTIVEPRAGYLPEEARAGETLSPQWIAKWDAVVPLSKPSAEPVTGEPFAKHPYFKAHGTFASPADIPAHYRYANPDSPEAGASELERKFARTDFGLLIEYQWTETVTNNVTLENFLANRDKLLDKLLPLVAAEIKRKLGKKYDTQRLDEYIQNEGRAIIVDLSLAYYELRANRLPQQELHTRLAVIARRHGLKTPAAERDTPSKIEEMWVSWPTQILVKTLRHRDGTVIDEAEAKELVTGAADDDNPEGVAEEDKEPLKLAFASVFGIYPWFHIFEGPEQFEFSLQLPGKLIETNGLLVEPSRSLWRFNADETFPAGYRMTARSIVMNPDVQRALVGRVVVNDVSQADRFIQLVGHDGPLLKAVQQAFASGKLDALRELESDTPELKNRVKSLQQLFEIE